MKKDKLKILFVSSEVDPFVKTGGLADVASSMPQAVKKMGHDIRVVMPEYSQIASQYLEQLEHLLYFSTQVGWRNEYVGVNKLDNGGVTTYFIDNKGYFYRDSLYENEDKHVQFAYFCRAVLEMLPKIDFQPDIIHCNDWQTGPLSIMLNENYKQYDFYKDIKTVYTIHNLRYQGRFGKEILDDTLALPTDKYWDSGIASHDGAVNYMKMAINGADKVTTVSKTYAEEIKTPYCGEGLDYVLRMNDYDLCGIVNGISYQNFNPQTDDRIYANYSADNLAGKEECKRRLQEDMGLPQRDDVPVIGLISRLVKQKGLDLIESILDDLMNDGIQFVILGTGDRYYEEVFRRAGERYPDKMAANIKYDAGLAQKIYAGCDMFLMPSEFEPCGLGQLISLRYGTLPIVRETGGLKDTVQAYNEDTDEGNGFSFAYYDAQDLLYTIRRAERFYYEEKEVWNNLVKRGMESDYSWNHSAKEYLGLYAELAEVDREKGASEVIEEKVEEKSKKIIKININTAKSDELQSLDGVGPSLAQKIVNYRQANGFSALEDLTKVPGIAKKSFEKLKSEITY